MEKEKYLVINAGSSSLKFSLYGKDYEEIAKGYIERIGIDNGFYSIKNDSIKIEEAHNCVNHTDAVEIMLKSLISNGFIAELSEIKGVGHRVLHGGEIYKESVLIDDEVLNNIVSLTKLGPLHLPGAIAGIKSLSSALPAVPQVAVLDTAFHQTMPSAKFMYALPYDYYEKYGVRKYGFHGTSHKYITEYMQTYYNTQDVNLIICHIGSGASIAAIKDGKCLNTTMGLTPLDGLIMATRSGSIDPSVVQYLVNETGQNINDIMDRLNKNSGLLGICGKNDFRDLLELKNQGDEKATLAYNMFADSIVKYIAQYYFELDSEVDAIVFTAGIGENVPEIRNDIMKKISKPMGIKLDEEANFSIGRGAKINTGMTTGKISAYESQIPVYVIPTDEEKMILNDTYRIVKSNDINKNKTKNLK